MEMQEILTEIFSLFKNEEHQGLTNQYPRQNPRINELISEILDTFGLPKLIIEEILVEFASSEHLSDALIDETLIKLGDDEVPHQTQTMLEEKNNNEVINPGDHSSDQKERYEQIDLEDGDDEILDRSIERAWQKIKIMEEAEKIHPKENLKNEPPSIANREVFDYVMKHLYVLLDEQEFRDIETGFRLLWNHATGQKLGDSDFKRAVDQYLTSIESPMDRKKMYKVVDLILEYQEEIGEWSDKSGF
jgi:hypothetical protein